MQRSLCPYLVLLDFQSFFSVFHLLRMNLRNNWPNCYFSVSYFFYKWKRCKKMSRYPRRQEGLLLITILILCAFQLKVSHNLLEKVTPTWALNSKLTVSKKECRINSEYIRWCTYSAIWVFGPAFSSSLKKCPRWESN